MPWYEVREQVDKIVFANKKNYARIYLRRTSEEQQEIFGRLIESIKEEYKTRDLLVLFNLFSMFWFSALYMNKTGSRNIFKALWGSILAVFKKPLSVIGFNLLIALLYFIVSQLSIVGRLHPVLSFIYMVLWVYFFVFINVLIFNYYGKNFGNIGDTGADSVGENEACA